MKEIKLPISHTTEEMVKIVNTVLFNPVSISSEFLNQLIQFSLEMKWLPAAIGLCYKYPTILSTPPPSDRYLQYNQVIEIFLANYKDDLALPIQIREFFRAVCAASIALMQQDEAFKGNAQFIFKIFRFSPEVSEKIQWDVEETYQIFEEEIKQIEPYKGFFDLMKKKYIFPSNELFFLLAPRFLKEEFQKDSDFILEFINCASKTSKNGRKAVFKFIVEQLSLFGLEDFDELLEVVASNNRIQDRLDCFWAIVNYDGLFYKKYLHYLPPSVTESQEFQTLMIHCLCENGFFEKGLSYFEDDLKDSHSIQACLLLLDAFEYGLIVWNQKIDHLKLGNNILKRLGDKVLQILPEKNHLKEFQALRARVHFFLEREESEETQKVECRFWLKEAYLLLCNKNMEAVDAFIQAIKLSKDQTDENYLAIKKQLKNFVIKNFSLGEEDAHPNSYICVKLAKSLLAESSMGIKLTKRLLDYLKNSKWHELLSKTIEQFLQEKNIQSNPKIQPYQTTITFFQPSMYPMREESTPYQNLLRLKSAIKAYHEDHYDEAETLLDNILASGYSCYFSVTWFYKGLCCYQLGLDLQGKDSQQFFKALSAEFNCYLSALNYRGFSRGCFHNVYDEKIGKRLDWLWEAAKKQNNGSDYLELLLMFNLNIFPTNPYFLVALYHKGLDWLSKGYGHYALTCFQTVNSWLALKDQYPNIKLLEKRELVNLKKQLNSLNSQNQNLENYNPSFSQFKF